MEFFKNIMPKEKTMVILEINEEIKASTGKYSDKSGTQEILDFLYSYFNKDKKIDGLLLRLNTPGGTAGASEEIAQMIGNLKEKRKIPIVATIADLCCSGGYMIACVADFIYANKGSLTGSIGTIMQIPNFRKASEKLGINYMTIKSGNMKDIGNPLREMTDEEFLYLKQIAEDTHDVFISHVKKYRPNIDEKMFDGRPVGAISAKEYGLIDIWGGYYDAYETLLRCMGEKSDDNVKIHKYEKKKGFAQKLFGSLFVLNLPSLFGNNPQESINLLK